MEYGAVYPSLKGRTVVVTGGGSGIGESIVRHFAHQGAKVGFLDIDEVKSQTVAGELQKEGKTVQIEHCDLTNTAKLDEALGRWRIRL